MNEKLVFLKQGDSKYIKLNVGGHLYTTTYDTLCKYDTMLKSMFTGNLEVLVDSEGYVLIDRSGKNFEKILNYLRDGKIVLSNNDETIYEILAEAEYYCITDLVLECKKALKIDEKVINSVYSIENVVADDEKPHTFYCFESSRKNNGNLHKMIQNSSKSVIMLYVEDHFSDEKKYKECFENIVLFEKLSTIYGKYITFIKYKNDLDILPGWMFYNREKSYSGSVCYEDKDFLLTKSLVYEKVMELLDSHLQ